jgi:ADP-ribose pyrophosphatase
MPDKISSTKVEKLLMRKYAFEGKLLKLRVDTVLGPDGRRTTREIVERTDCIAVVPIDADNNVLLVSQFRTPLWKHLLEIPAGSIEKGEDAEKAVVREMQEETSFKPAKVIRLCGGYLAPGYSSEYCSIYLATELSLAPLHAEDTAGIDVLKMPVSEVMGAITTGRIQDSKSIAGLLYYLEWKKKNPESIIPVFTQTSLITQETLQKEWEEYQAAPFPKQPEDVILADVCSDLALENREITGIVKSFLQGKKVDKKHIYINEELKKKLHEYMPSTPEAEVSRQLLIEQVDQLERLVKLVLELYDK